MKTSFLLAFFIFCNSLSIAVADGQGAAKEYCETESFAAECFHGQAILITSAFYGRMKTGRCISGNNTGCSTDAKPYLDRWCSGRRKCDVLVIKLILDVRNTCDKDFRSYLEAGYTCVPVIHSASPTCSSRHVTETVSGSGYLSSYVTAETGCGSIDRPWQINAGSGQRISITLLDFSSPDDVISSPSSSNVGGRSSAASTSGVGDGGHVCTVYATIKETSGGQTATTICGGKSREKNEFMSNSNSIEIRVLSNRKNDDEPKFMLFYEVIGCQDPVIPTGGWLKRDPHEAIVGCYQSTRQWHLHCNGTQWIGQNIGDCQSGSAKIADDEDKTRTETQINLKGLSIVIIAAVAAIVGLLILFVGVIHLRRRHHLNYAAKRDRNEKIQRQEDIDTDSPDGAGARRHHQEKEFDEFAYDATAGYPSNKWQVVGISGQGTLVPMPTQYRPLPEGGSTARYSEHLYESPNFERRDFPLLAASLSRQNEFARNWDGRQCAVSSSGRRSLTDPGCAAVL